jgi:hypothetical protein
MKNIEENDLVPLEVDLGLSRRGELEEGPLRIFGNVVKIILNRMFGGSSQPVRVRGTKREINSFTQTLGREKRYMDSYIRNGLDDPRTLSNRHSLEKAVRSFESETGLKWPLK